MNRAIVVMFTLAVAAACPARGQFTTVVNTPPELWPQTVASNTQVNLLTGGLAPDFTAVGESGGAIQNVEVNLQGGDIGDDFKLLGGVTLNVQSGRVNRGLSAYDDSLVHVTGGRISGTSLIESGATLILDSGQIDSTLRARTGSSVQIHGGILGIATFAPGSDLLVTGGQLSSLSLVGTATITGGSIPYGLSIEGTTTLAGGSINEGPRTRLGSQLELHAADVRLDGVAVQPGALPGDRMALNIPAGAVLSGTLADGTPFVFSPQNETNIQDGTLTLVAADPPPAPPGVINVPAQQAPNGVHTAQTLVVHDAGVVPNWFQAGWGSDLIVKEGGIVGDGLVANNASIRVEGSVGRYAQIYHGTTLDIENLGNVGGVLVAGDSIVNVNGGQLGSVSASTGSTVNLHGGEIGGMGLTDATINVYAGTVGGGSIRPGSELNLYDGYFEGQFTAYANTRVRVAGGSFGDVFWANSGSDVVVTGGGLGEYTNFNSGSSLRLVGGEFYLNGEEIRVRPQPTGTFAQLNLPRDFVLSGVLADGTPIVFAESDDDAIDDGVLTLEFVNLPPVDDLNVAISDTASFRSLREGQQVHLLAGGTLPNGFTAGPGSRVVADEGSSIGKGFEAIGAQVEIRGGVVGEDFDAFRGSVVNIRGGSLGAGLTAHAGSVLNLFGVGFEFDGVPLTDLVPGETLVMTDLPFVLTGRLADGTDFRLPIFSGRGPIQHPDAVITLTLVPEPSCWSMACILLATIAGMRAIGHSGNTVARVD